MSKVNSEIDILKFLFSIVIVFCHWHFHNFYAGFLAVEFFFIVSGFFYARKMDQNNTGGGILLDCVKFSPFLASGITVALIYHFLLNGWTLKTLRTTSLLAIGELLNFQMFGLPMFSSTGVTWYLSAMLIAKLLIFPILKTKNHLCILTLLCMFIYGYLNKNRGMLAGPGDWLGITYVGTLRGIAGISLGILCHKLTEKLKTYNYTLIGRFFFTILECFLYLVSVCYMWKSRATQWDFYIVLILFIGIAITMSEISFFSFINRWKIPFFRNASICIFLSHFYIVQYFEKNHPNFSGDEVKFLVIMQVIVCSTLTFLLSILYKKLGSFFYKKCFSVQ